jgi:hypothetical protein
MLKNNRKKVIIEIFAIFAIFLRSQSFLEDDLTKITNWPICQIGARLPFLTYFLLNRQTCSKQVLRFEIVCFQDGRTLSRKLRRSELSFRSG